MKKLIKIFRKYKNNFLDVFIEIIGEVLSINYKYRKNQLKSLTALKILDTGCHFNLKFQVQKCEYLGDLVFKLMICIICLFILNIIPIHLGIVYLIIFIFLFLVSLYFLLIVFDYFILFISDICRAFSLNNTFFKRISKRRIVIIILFFLKTFNMKLLILLSVNALLISDLYRTSVLSIANKENLVTQIFRSHDLSIIFNGEIWKFWLISITIFIPIITSFHYILEFQDIFDLEDMDYENHYMEGFLTVIIFIIGFDYTNIKLIGIFLLSLIILTVVFNFFKSNFLFKKYKNAQGIFQNQLIVDVPSYEELKKCYYYGGEKYKEKLMSVEKFIVVIAKNELKSLKDLKNYDDYKLYKAIRERNI